jgi:hypothetical protein
MSWLVDRRRASVQELLPLDAIVDGVLCLRGGHYRAALEATSINFALKSESEQEAILAGYRAFLNALDYPLQILVRVLPTDVETYLTALRRRLAGSADASLRRLALDHEAFVRRLARERTLLTRRFYVLVPAGLDGAAAGQGPSWPWRTGRQRERRRGLEAAAGQLDLRCREVGQGLGGFGVATRRLGSDELAWLWRDALAAEPRRVGRPALVARPVVTAHRAEEGEDNA